MTMTMTGAKNKNTSVDYDVGCSQEDPDCGGRSEYAEDDQAQPVDHLKDRGYQPDINLIKQRKVAFIIIEDNKNQNVILQWACTVSASLISVQILTVSSK